MDKSLFFLFMAFLMFWLILDEVYGNKIIGNFIDNMLGRDTDTAAASLQSKVSDLKYMTGGIK